MGTVEVGRDDLREFDNGEKDASGQYERYAVLPESDRRKGFVRPYRDTYKHIGPREPRFPLLDLTQEQQDRYAAYGYVKYEKYPDSGGSVVGKFWTQGELDRVGKCGYTTSMGRALSETYARDPKYYGATFCAHCGQHYPVGEDGEFVWLDGEKVGT